MKKNNSATVYVCTECDAEHIRWMGKCSSCQSWNSLEESTKALVKTKKLSAIKSLVALSEVKLEEDPRISSKIPDLDQVLGGGIVADSIILLAGEPGVGKSTLMLELARNTKWQCYYFSGEESVRQISQRAKRMGITNEKLFISRETNLEQICNSIEKKNGPVLSIIDSIQTVYSSEHSGAAGSPSQLRDAALMLLETARKSKSAVLLTGHITKDGSIAGPRILEHMVDVVLYFESDRTNNFRILRAVKNRFGAVGEVAVFEMLNTGMRAVSSLPLSRNRDKISGSVHSLMLGGSRPITIEVQALVTRCVGPPKRVSEGLDNKRLVLLAAVLEKYCKGFNLAECDIFANLVGGFSSDEPALDLAQCLAILSSYLELPISSYTACLGELGLGGELRAVSRLSIRLRELKNLGFRTVFVPKENLSDENSNDNFTQTSNDGSNNKMNVIAIGHIHELLDRIQK